MQPSKPIILITEDEPKVLGSLATGFREFGFHVLPALTGEEGLVLLLETKPDVIILDLNLPGRDGLEILNTIRRHDSAIPVLILSARDTVEDRVSGLETGADDYLTKPFAFSELLARIKALLRREIGKPKPEVDYKLNDLELHIITRKAFRGERDLNLTPKEFELLALLLRNRDQPVSRKILIQELWKVDRATSLNNVIDVHIMRLRKKIDAPGESKLIHTIRGLGFMITDNPDFEN